LSYKFDYKLFFTVLQKHPAFVKNCIFLLLPKQHEQIINRKLQGTKQKRNKGGTDRQNGYEEMTTENHRITTMIWQGAKEDQVNIY